MLADSKHNIGFGIIEGLHPNTSITYLVEFLEKKLIVFARKFSHLNIKNEKGLTQELCIILNEQAREEGQPFWFEKEFMENVTSGTSPQVDIAVLLPESIESKLFSHATSFFSIEAKRLTKLSVPREKEYLVGREEQSKYKHCGGVERFKAGIHALNLNHSALIGYVQSFDFSHWHQRINTWIDELIQNQTLSQVNWNQNDKLEKLHQNNITATYLSKNSRTAGSISLYHLWVNLVK